MFGGGGLPSSLPPSSLLSPARRNAQSWHENEWGQQQQPPQFNFRRSRARGTLTMPQRRAADLDAASCPSQQEMREGMVAVRSFGSLGRTDSPSTLRSELTRHRSDGGPDRMHASHKTPQTSPENKCGHNSSWPSSFLDPSERRGKQLQLQRQRVTAGLASGALHQPHMPQQRQQMQQAPESAGPGLLRPTPMLTLLLVKLESNIGGYCETLANPTAANAAIAAKLLDWSVVTKPSLSEMSNPSRGRSGSGSGGTRTLTHSAPSSPSSRSLGAERVEDNDDYYDTDNDSNGGASPLSPSSVKSLIGRNRRFANRRPRLRARGGGGGDSAFSPKRKTTTTGAAVASSPPSLIVGAAGRLTNLAQSLSWTPPTSPARGAAAFVNEDDVATGSSPPVHTLANEWDRYVAPLLLLAGAEVLYGRMEHAADSAYDDAATGGTGAADDKRSGGLGGALLRWLHWPLRPGEVSAAVAAAPARRRAAAPASGSQDCGVRARAKKLADMYDKVAEDARIVREILCDPILGGGSGTAAAGREPDGGTTDGADDGRRRKRSPSIDGASSKVPHFASASSLGRTLDAIVAFAEARREMIEIHSDLFLFRGGAQGRGPAEAARGANVTDGSDPCPDEAAEDASGMDIGRQGHPSLLELSERCDSLLPLASLIKGECRPERGCGLAWPMVEGLSNEIKGLSAALAASHYLMRCSFFETVLNVKKLKVHLRASTCPTPIQLWLRLFLINLLSMMPVFFDRIDAFSSPLYSFQKQLLAREGQHVTGAESKGLFGISGLQAQPSSRQLQNDNDHSRDISVCPAAERDVGPEHYGTANNLDAVVIEFLRKHQNKGGSPLAVSVVFDSASAKQPNFERGFICSPNMDKAKPKNDTECSSQDDPLRLWPATYMRTTIHAGTAGASIDFHHQSATNSVANLMNWNGGKSSRSRSGLNLSPDKGSQLTVNRSRSSSQSTRIRSSQSTKTRSVDSESATMHQGGHDSRLNVLEYAPASGKVTWPHNEWPKLVSLISSQAEIESAEPSHSNVWDGNAVTYKDSSPMQSSTIGSTNSFDGIEVENANIAADSMFKMFPSVMSIASLADAGGADDTLGGGKTNIAFKNLTRTGSFGGVASGASSPQARPHGTLPSAYHAVRLNKFMWMVVIVEGETEKWHRRRPRGLADDEIRSFLNEMASMLSIDKLFGEYMIAKARSASQCLDVPVVLRNMNLSSLWKGGCWKETESNNFLNDVKDMLGLQPSSPLMEPLKSPYFNSSLRTRRAQQSKKRAVSETKQRGIGSDHEMSAMAFFLGPELCQF